MLVISNSHICIRPIWITEHTESIHNRTDFVLFWKRNSWRDKKLRQWDWRNHGTQFSRQKTGESCQKNTITDYSVFFRTNRYSVYFYWNTNHHSFRIRNRSQKNTITVNSVYSHSGIVPKEHSPTNSEKREPSCRTISLGYQCQGIPKMYLYIKFTWLFLTTNSSSQMQKFALTFSLTADILKCFLRPSNVRVVHHEISYSKLVLRWGPEWRYPWMEVTSRPIAAKGHVTYPPINLIPNTLWIPETQRAEKKKNCQVWYL